MRAGVVVAALALVAPALAVAATPVQRAFSDWTVTCDNGLRCVALAGQDEAGRVVAIVREAGPDADVSLELNGEGMDSVDGRTLDYPSPHWREEDNGYPIRRTTDLATIQRFVDEVRNGSRLLGDGDGDTGLSLRGLSAALLFIDDAQGRLGTRGALLRRGSKAESTVPAAPALPLLHPAPAPRPLAEADAVRLAAGVRRSQADALAKAECDEEQGPNADQAWALSDSEALVYLGCWMGAYQGSGLVFRTDRNEPGKSTRVLLPSVPGEPAMDMLTSAEYDPSTAQLHHYAKARGLGDCGEIVGWVFDGKAFLLAEHAAMQQCTGVHSDQWPTRWRSRIVAGSSK